MCVTVCGRLNHLIDDLQNEGGIGGGGQRHKGECLMLTESSANITQSGDTDGRNDFSNTLQCSIQ